MRFFASVSGLWGVLVTDTLQCTITMSGTFAVAYGGRSDIAQRMLAPRSEQDAVTGTLRLNLMHDALHPWPWIIVALARTLTYPQRTDIGRRGFETGRFRTSGRHSVRRGVRRDEAEDEIVDGLGVLKGFAEFLT
jgi:hypothetical protein